MKTVLVVEDEPDFQKLLKLLLEGQGYRALVAGGVQEAWETLLGERPEMLLLDLNLGDGDGISFCKKVRAEKSFKDLPIIILTVRSKPEDIVLGLRSGADDYIAKPFEPDEVLTRVEILFRRMET